MGERGAMVILSLGIQTWISAPGGARGVRALPLPEMQPKTQRQTCFMCKVILTD